MQTTTRVRELLKEAEAELGRYDQLRANILVIIESYQQRLKLLGADDGSAMLLPYVEEQVKEKESPAGTLPPNPEFYEGILLEMRRPMTSKQVWAVALERGAQSQSANPVRVVDTTLRKLAKAHKIDLIGPGQFKARVKPIVVPD